MSQSNSKFSHEESYRGNDLLAKGAAKQIVVCGTGALGSNLVDMLCRQGFTKIRVIDMDRVEIHNINTQVFGNGDIGAMKVAALKNRIFRDTGVELETVDKELTSSTLKKAFKGSDLIIDTFDNHKSRKLVYDFAKDMNTSCLHGGMFEGYGEVVWNGKYTVPNDAPEAQDICAYPLARNLVILVTTIMAEEISDYCVSNKPRYQSWAITLKDLKISGY